MLLVQQNEDLKIKASYPDIQPESNHCTVTFFFKFVLLHVTLSLRAYFIGKTERA